MENTKSENIFEIKTEKENSFQQDIPALIHDVNLFRLLLTPSELYVFKMFLESGKPLNLRQLYENSIDISFNYIFSSKDDNLRTEFIKKAQPIWNTFQEAGYGKFNYMTEKEKQKIFDRVHSFEKGESPSKYINREYKELVAQKIKMPSYDRIKTIVTSFEKKGIFQSRKEANVVFYTLNPKIYLSIKDKRDAILNL